MAMGVIIRPCRPDDCAKVLDLWGKAEAAPSVTDTLENLLELVQQNSDMFLVADFGGQLVGTVIAGWDGWRGNIYRLAVLPEYKQRGIGKALIQEVEKRLRDKGARRVSILVEPEDALAIALWNSLSDIGYKQDTRMVRYVKTL